MDEKIRALLDAITEIVDDPGSGPWREKRDAIRKAAEADQAGTLDEFLSWFDDDE